MRRSPQFGFKTSQSNVGWETLLATWELGDSLAVFDSGWLFDHFVGVSNQQPTDHGSHEAWTVGAALAAKTRRIRLGHLVLGNGYRHPALLARMATTIDHIAGPSRFVLGIGAGWLEQEHRMFGWEFPTVRDRMARLEASAQLIKGMWDSPAGSSFSEGPYRLQNAVCEPPPVTPGGPPIWIGTQGLRRGLRIVAKCGDGWNASGDLVSYLEKRDALFRHCEDVGRDPGEIEISAQLAYGGRNSEGTLNLARDFLLAGVEHLIFVMTAADGPAGLQRLADQVVSPLREEFS